MNPVAAQICLLDRIPFVGHMKSLIYYYGGEKVLAAEACKCATHYIGVVGFGVVGGLLAGPLYQVGSFLGGIFGGISIDVLVSFLSSNRYGYPDKCCNSNMERVDWKGLLQLAITDGVVGLTTFKAQQLMIEYLTNSTVRNQTDGGNHIQCSSATCKEPDFTKGGNQFENREIDEGTKIPVEDIKQLKSGLHVVYERGSGKSIIYGHHAIIGDVDQGKGKYTAYEQSPNMNWSQTGKASIKENEKIFYKNSCYILDHGNTGISNVEAKKMAHYICYHARDGFLNKAYNLIFNNCEHFANYCATGKNISHQIRHISNIVVDTTSSVLYVVCYFISHSVN